jgi:hypothetical protein
VGVGGMVHTDVMYDSIHSTKGQKLVFVKKLITEQEISV